MNKPKGGYMNKPKHTPGPWTLGYSTRHPIKFNEYDLVQNVCTLNRHPGGITEANARLIAAAPELLEACRLLLDSLLDKTYDPNGNHKSGRIILATELIAKATSDTCKS